MTRKTGLVWLLLLFCTAVRASNLRQISSREGISNNAILSLAQDKHGFIWVGSCDGLNMWDGERMRLFPNDWGGETPLSGNLIEEIAVTTDSLFWIRTNYGLDLFDPDSKRVERHADFQGMYKIVTRRSNEVLVVTQDNKFSCYDPAARRFSSVQPMSGIDYADILDMQLDDDGALWVFSRKGIFRIPVAFPDKNNDRIGIGQPERFPTVSNPEYAFAENGSGFFIDENHIFYEFDIRERRLIYNKDMSDEMARMGSVSSIVRDGGDYIVSFYTNGVIRLRTTPEQSVKYATEHINIPCGVFSLLRDARQEIVWIGTDGQGLYQHTRNATAFRSITFNQLPYNLSKPVRALYIDDERTLWVGTKGEGILRIADFYDRKEFTPAHVQQLTADNSELLDNSVYAFARSRRNLLWIGTDGEGLNYYSYGDRRIRTLREGDHTPPPGGGGHPAAEIESSAQEPGPAVLLLLEMFAALEIGQKYLLKHVVRIRPAAGPSQCEAVHHFFVPLQDGGESLLRAQRLLCHITTSLRIILHFAGGNVTVEADFFLQSPHPIFRCTIHPPGKQGRASSHASRQPPSVPRYRKREGK